MKDSVIKTALNPDISSGLDLAYFISLLIAVCILGGIAIIVIGKPWIMSKFSGVETTNAVDKIDRALRYLDRQEADSKTMRDTLTSLKTEYIHLERRVEHHEKRLDALETNYSLLRTDAVSQREEFRQGVARAHERIDAIHIRGQNVS